MNGPTLVIMAAGMGSRYGGLKQLDSVGPSGELIIDYSIYDALKAGFGKVVFIIRKHFEGEFRDKIGRTIEKHADTAYAFQEIESLPDGFAVPEGREKPWGTGHAILCASEVVNEPFAVINADDFYGAGSFKSLSDFLKTAEDRDGIYNHCMVGYIMKNTLTDHGHVSRGACQEKDGFLESITELKKIMYKNAGVCYEADDGSLVDIDPDITVSMNMFGYTPGIFGELQTRFVQFLHNNIDNLKSEFFLPLVTSDLIEKGKATVRILPTDEQWLGVTYQEDKPYVVDAVNDLVTKGVYPARLWDE